MSDVAASPTQPQETTSPEVGVDKEPASAPINQLQKPQEVGGKEEPVAEEQAQSSSTPWQAIWSPQYNAYYFYNSETNETTWVNPLAPDSSASTEDPASEPQSEQPEATPSSSISGYSALQAAAIAQGIDPSLAHLDPSLAASSPDYGLSSLPSFTAKFNARTGAFARQDARDPTHLSEFERAKRMSEFYFDVGAWEKNIEESNAKEAEGEGKKRKRPTKTDLERFKEQKRQKKIAKTAWLRT